MKRLTIALATIATLVAGCAFDPSSVKLPGTTVSGDKYSLDIEFANVLNLPPGAKVIANGVRVGDLDKLRIVDPDTNNALAKGYIVATVQVKSSVQLPTTTKVELRQATPLGDVHIALLVPPSDSNTAMFEPGATIPLSQTIAAAPVEDTLAGLATVVGGGTITDIQDTVRQLNAALPADPKDTTRIFNQLKADLVDVGANVQTVDAVLAGLGSNVGVLLDDADILDQLLTASGVDHEVKVIGSLVKVLFLFTALGPLAHKAIWLAPLVNSLDEAATAFVPMILGNRPLDLGSPSNLKKLVDLIQYKIIPFVEHGPKVNIATATVSGPAAVALTPADQTNRIVDTLRMIGAVR